MMAAAAAEAAVALVVVVVAEGVAIVVVVVVAVVDLAVSVVSCAAGWCAESTNKGLQMGQPHQLDE